MAGLQRKGGRWYAYFRIGGSAFNPSLGEASDSEAEIIRHRIEDTLRQIEMGRLRLPEPPTRAAVCRFVLSGGVAADPPTVLPPPRAVWTLGAAVDEYKASVRGKEPSTMAGEAIHLAHLIRILGEETPFADLAAPEPWERYRDAREKPPKRAKKRGGPRKAGPATIAKEFRTFAQVWKFAASRGHVTGRLPKPQLDNPEEAGRWLTWDEASTMTKRMKPEAAKAVWERVWLDDKQAAELLEAIRGTAREPWIYPAVAMAVYTGARRSEVIASHIEDWVLDAAIVKVRGRKDSRKRSLTFRSVPIHPKLGAIFADWMKVHPGGVHAFTTGDGAITPDRMHRAFRGALEGTQWATIHGWHTLRHSFISNCARRGVPDLTLDRWVGHAGNEAIKQRYRHLVPSDEQSFIRTVFGDEEKKTKNLTSDHT